MTHAKVVEYQALAIDHDAAAVSLLFNELHYSILLQLVRLLGGLTPAFSIYAVYREGQVTFEASAKVAVDRADQSIESLLFDLIQDAEFLDSVVVPIRVEVEKHFAALRTSA